MTATLPPLPVPTGYVQPRFVRDPDVRTGYFTAEQMATYALAAIAAQAQPAPIVVQPEPMQSFADRIKNGIADHLSDNAPMRRYDLAEIDELIRSVEIRADMLATTPPVVQPVQPTPLDVLTALRRVVAADDAHASVHAADSDDVARMVEWAEAFDEARETLALHGIGSPGAPSTTGGAA